MPQTLSSVVIPTVALAIVVEVPSSERMGLKYLLRENVLRNAACWLVGLPRCCHC